MTSLGLAGLAWYLVALLGGCGGQTATVGDARRRRCRCEGFDGGG